MSRDTAKPAKIVNKNDRRVLQVRGYAETLAKAEAWGKYYHLRLQVVLIITDGGEPHAERRCNKLVS